MKVLMISLDKSVADTGSRSAERMRMYGAICEELHILILGAGGEKTKLSENIFIYPASANRILSLFSAVKTGRGIISGGGQWVVSAQDPFEAGFIGWLLAKKSGAGLEIQLHGDFYGNPYWRREKLINRARFFLGKFVLRRADAVRAVSERIKRSVLSLTKAEINVVPIHSEIPAAGANADFLKNKFPDSFPIILAAGNLVPVKNHKLLIEAFAEIKKIFPGAKLVIAGDGPLFTDYGLQITDYGLQNDIWLADYQNNLSDFYRSADIFVHPSFYEGWGRAVVEAASFGLPIVMSDTGLAGEVIKSNESGIVVRVNDKEALKNAIIALAKDENLRKKLGEGASRAVAALPDKERYLQKIKQAWEAISGH